MLYRRPLTEHDYQAMLDLQNQNLAWNLTAEEAFKEGSLQRAFSLEAFQAMEADLGVMLAWGSEKTLAGYLCANRFIENPPLEVIRALYQYGKTVLYRGKPLTDYKAFVASPLCLHRAFRRTGVFFRLCSAMLNSPRITPDYEQILTFVSIDNPRSLQACQRISFHPLKDFFRIQGFTYWVLVKTIDLTISREILIQPSSAIVVAQKGE